MTGQQVSHYTILQQLGAGGMGMVYAAEDRRLGRRVALKLLPPELSADPQAMERFEREARAASALNHPHICTIHDVGNADGRQFIVMELLEGDTLQCRLTGSKMSIPEVLRVGAQIADALAAAHARGIVHRDIKPGNIFLTARGDAKVLDFGLAKLAGELHVAGEGQSEFGTLASTQEPLTRPGSAVGTIAYMSPEQARGEPLDARTDLFSFGLVLYEMASGKPAFSGRTSAVIFDAILHQTPPDLRRLNPDVPRELEEVVLKAVEKDPAVRYQTAADMLADLRRLQRDKAAASGSISGPSRAVPTRRRTLIVATAAVVALAIGLAVWSFSRQRNETLPVGPSGRPSLAVLTFEAPGASPDKAWLARGIPTMLVTGLAQTADFVVVSNERVDEIVKELAAADGLDPSRRLAVGRRAGAGSIVAGSVFTSGADYRIDVRVQEVATGRVMSAHTVTGNNVFSLVDDLSSRIRAGTAARAGPTERVAEVTSGNLEAFRLYTEGRVALANLRNSQAYALLEQAVKLDPSFAAAWFYLLRASERLGNGSMARTAERELRVQRSRLPDRERAMLDAVEVFRAGQVAKAEEILTRALDRFPDEDGIYTHLLTLYAETSREKAIALIDRGVRNVPNSGPFRNMAGYAYLANGRYPEAVREFEAYVRLQPKEPNALDSLGEAYLISGQIEKALDTYRRAEVMDPAFGAQFGRAYGLSMIGRFDEALNEINALLALGDRADQSPAEALMMRAFLLSRIGRYRESADSLRQSEAIAARASAMDQVVRTRLSAALVAMERGDFEAALRAARHAEEAAQSGPADSRRMVAVVAGIADIRAGRSAAARSFLEQERLMSARTRFHIWLHQSVEGELALANGDLAAAERAFAVGEPEFRPGINFSIAVGWPALYSNAPFRDGPARIRIARGDLTGAIDIYRRLLAPDISQKWTSILEPRFVLQLARLLDRTGDRAGAREQYQRFLDLWRRADLGLPEVTEAKQRLAALR
jgi:serine/threonine protein kinase/tetratricopeptide (TPR) repeat protein